ncbi:MAG: VOC family protein [Acidimicrobiales bacterium]|jgi:glyoxylase I family protein|nr:VOC family protein [Acidimicrobiales bacterium]
MEIIDASHVGIAVADMDRSMAWYHDVLGWRLLFDEQLEGEWFETITGVPGATGRACGGRIGSLRVELMAFPHTPQRPRGAGLGLSVLSIQVPDLQAARDELEARGIRALGPIVEMFGTRMFFVADPDGQPVELVEYLPGSTAWGGEHAR